jgi:hypothetical protein
MVRTSQSDNPKMLNLTSRQSGRCARWCALVVMVAACALAVRVATRYGSFDNTFTSRINVSETHHSQEHGRQRLIRDAIAWVPRLIVVAGEQRPVTYAVATYEGPPVSLPSFVSQPYYRPPPISSFLS